MIWRPRCSSVIGWISAHLNIGVFSQHTTYCNRWPGSGSTGSRRCLLNARTTIIVRRTWNVVVARLVTFKWHHFKKLDHVSALKQYQPECYLKKLQLMNLNISWISSEQQSFRLYAKKCVSQNDLQSQVISMLSCNKDLVITRRRILGVTGLFDRRSSTWFEAKYAWQTCATKFIS